MKEQKELNELKEMKESFQKFRKERFQSKPIEAKHKDFKLMFLI